MRTAFLAALLAVESHALTSTAHALATFAAPFPPLQTRFRRAIAEHRSCARMLSGPAARFSPVQETALYTAFWRHCETTRKDTAPLIEDTLAQRLVSEFLAADVQARLRNDAAFQAARDLLACRTKFIDDMVVRWHQDLKEEEEPVLQVVVLGAGMDTRPFRILRGRDVLYFETDRDQSVLEWKHETLCALGGMEKEASPSVACFGCDLSLAPQVLAQGNELDGLVCRDAAAADRWRRAFKAARPTVFILEGLMEYLDPALHHDLFVLLRSAVQSTGGGEAGGQRDIPAKHLIILQNLEPSFGETFNRDGNLPYQRLVSSAEQVAALHAAGFSGARVFDPAYFQRKFGRETNTGFNMITATC